MVHTVENACIKVCNYIYFIVPLCQLFLIFFFCYCVLFKQRNGSLFGLRDIQVWQTTEKNKLVYSALEIYIVKSTVNDLVNKFSLYHLKCYVPD